MEQFDANKAPGPDGIYPRFLSKTASALAHPLGNLFRLSLQVGEIPEDWKQAVVTPIYKRKGSKQTASNYRPVSLTCILCKVMETLVREEVVRHLREHNLINKEQHGFVQGKSCLTHLLEALDDWTQKLGAGHSVDSTYMDFKKAFDTVPHRRLLMTLKAHGIGGCILEWITAFLSGRHQRVVVNGAFSEEATVTSGIPQGSVLGPVLFVVYINDLPCSVENNVKLFADDTKLYASSDKPSAAITLQSDLDKLQEWSNQWLLRFHPDKCTVLKLGTRKSDAKYYMKGEDINGNEIDVVLSESQVEKDLGVWIDSGLTFKEQVNAATEKANNVLGIIRRTFETLNSKMFIQLYKALVRPLLEYGHTAWEPRHKTLRRKVEDVQRRATKLIASLSNLPYSERLRRLDLPSLEHRRLRGDMIDLFKYMNQIYEATTPVFTLSENKSGTRGNGRKLFPHHCKGNIRSNFFSERSIPTWNSLPNDVVLAPSVNAFKNRLDNFWKDLPSKYEPDCQ